MKLLIEINCDNAAFEDNCAVEVDCILSGWIKKIKRDGVVRLTYMLNDTNGNSVGTARFEE